MRFLLATLRLPTVAFFFASALLLAQDVPQAPELPPGTESLLSRFIKDPTLVAIAIPVLGAVIMAIRKLIAFAFRTWGAAREDEARAAFERAKATQDANDDSAAAENLRRAQLEHKVADKLAEVVEKPK